METTTRTDHDAVNESQHTNCGYGCEVWETECAPADAPRTTPAPRIEAVTCMHGYEMGEACSGCSRAPRIEVLVLSIAANQFTVPLPTGKEVVKSVNSHQALIDALIKIMGGYGEPVSADIASAALKLSGE